MRIVAMKNYYEHSITCQPDADHHCLTCSDEAITVIVKHIDPASGIAFVEVGNQIEEVDMTLVEDVAPGDLLLVHGGVAIARLEEEEINVH
jgi:hydrogenase maturation factor